MQKSFPKIRLSTKTPVREAESAANITGSEKLLCTSSRANIAPDKGALNITARPELAHPVINNLFSKSLLLNILAKPSPIEAPI